jgi:hypothetical protein
LRRLLRSGSRRKRLSKWWWRAGRPRPGPADCCYAVRTPLRCPQSRIRDALQISRDQLDRFRHATAGFTTSALHGYGLRDHFARSPGTLGLIILALRYPSPPSGWNGTCTRKLSNMHGVPKKGRGSGAAPLVVWTIIEFNCVGTLRVTALLGARERGVIATALPNQMPVVGKSPL